MHSTGTAKSPSSSGNTNTNNNTNRAAPMSPPPKPTSSSYHHSTTTTSSDAFGFSSPNGRSSQNYPTSPSVERRSAERFAHYETDRPSELAECVPSQIPTVVLRRLPANLTHEALDAMLLFAEDLVDLRLATQEYPDDRGFTTAVARFRTFEGAIEVRNKLHGKSNATHDATMVVEIMSGGNVTPDEFRRRSSEAQPNRQMSASASSGASSGGLGNRQSSRFNGFQSMDRMSPTRRSQGPGAIEPPNSDVNNHIQSIFSPQSPIGTSYGDRTRVTGKSVIGDDAVDDETGELLKDPLAYAKSGQMDSNSWQSRASISRLAKLTLDTTNDTFSDVNGSMMSPPGASYGSSRNAPPPLKSPVSEFPQNGVPNGVTPMSPHSAYPISPQHFQRHQYPPANPADQNPPCNTLYVGNLPIDTSEDELKAMFSKQRGYKRLCFRTKHNGPMCFVEFEDISFATKALNELYGQPLHNSVKGGIRLSFSKNPLGVRTGQGNGMGPVSPLTSPTSAGFGNIGAPPGFSTANGPPPGLPLPSNSMSNVNPHTTQSFFPPNSPPLSKTNQAGIRHPSVSSGSYGGSSSGNGAQTIGTGFSDYQAGR